MKIVKYYYIYISTLNGTKNALSMAKTIPLPVDGPESIEWDPQGGGPYAAVVDGRILKWRGDGLGWVEFAYTSPHRFFLVLQRLLEHINTCIVTK